MEEMLFGLVRDGYKHTQRDVCPFKHEELQIPQRAVTRRRNCNSIVMIISNISKLRGSVRECESM